MGVVAFRGWAVLGLILAVAGVGCQSARGPANSVSLRAQDPLSDGVVIRVNAEAGEAYVSLTKADHVQVGMKFATFNPRIGVQAHGSDAQFVVVGESVVSVRGTLYVNKSQSSGSLEIVEVGEKFSRCRIVPVTGVHGLQAGDLLFNSVYHAMRDRKLHFVIGGDFDLDGDGIPTASERDRLERMIVAWGGVVDQKVTVRTDYLILGKRPAEPAIGEKPVVPHGVVDERAQVQKVYAEFEVDARRLAIPVLNENRALTLLGYYAVASR